MLEEIFAPWLSLQLNLCNMYVSSYFRKISKIKSTIYKKYQSLLFKFSVWTAQSQNVLNFLLFIAFITKLQPLNQDLITIEKMFLLNK